MAKSKKVVKKSVKPSDQKSKSAKGLLSRIFKGIAGFLAKITLPIRRTKIWQFLRRKILRSPFGGYFVNSWRELRKVTWPNRKTTWKFTFTVIVFSAFFAALVSALDYGFDNLAQRIFLQ